MNQAAEQRVEAASEMLLAAHRRNELLPERPEACAPRDVDDAYAVQDRVRTRLGATAGWKVGATGPAAEPVAAPLLAARITASPARLPAANFRMIGIEAELAFRLGRPLPPRAQAYSRDEVCAAVESLHPAIEIVDTRLPDWETASAPWRLADNQSNGHFVHGAGRGDWHGLDFARQPVKLTFDGATAAQGTGGNAAIDLVRLLVWLANHCRERRDGLAAGDFVTTGTYTGLLFVEPGTVVVADFPGVGTVEVSLAV